MKQRINLYTRFERLWHWIQAAFFIVLFLTGFEVHGSVHLMGYEKAHGIHIYVGWSLLILTAFAIFWHMTTGAWRNYVPTSENIMKITDFYLRGIFKGEPHPHQKTPVSKFNPLQRFAYLWLKVFAMPLVFTTGILYFYYNNWGQWGINTSLELIAILHIALAYLLLVFLVVHTYLSTTGGTIWTYIKEMITGYEE